MVSSNKSSTTHHDYLTEFLLNYYQNTHQVTNDIKLSQNSLNQGLNQPLKSFKIKKKMVKTHD